MAKKAASWALLTTSNEAHPFLRPAHVFAKPPADGELEIVAVLQGPGALPCAWS
ncbi:MAG TPA: hypothetical protein VKK19_20365 [Candidatus Dormibacteraeota bacterium]|nr:hypothetical protein [Candidatus Dormibacteraeota bacterium]